MPTMAEIEALARQAEDVESKTKAFRGCFYGPSGVGKSVLAIQTAQNLLQNIPMGILHIDTAEGWVSLENHDGLRKRVKSQPFTTISDLEIISYAIENKIGLYSRIGVVVLDEGSKMSKIDIDRAHTARMQNVSESSDKFSHTPEWPDYHVALARYRRMLYSFYKIPGLHVIITAHEKDRVYKSGREAGQIEFTFPGFTKEIAKEVKEPLHLVASITATYVNDPKVAGPSYARIAQVHPTKRYDAKTRIYSDIVSMDVKYIPDWIGNWARSGGPIAEAVAIPTEEADDVVAEAQVDIEDKIPDISDLELDSDFTTSVS